MLHRCIQFTFKMGTRPQLLPPPSAHQHSFCTSLPILAPAFVQLLVILNSLSSFSFSDQVYLLLVFDVFFLSAFQK
jgi:hypothetical protein